MSDSMKKRPRGRPPGTGRPIKAPEDKRTESVTIWLTAEEKVIYDAIEKAPEYLRQKLREAQT